MGYGTNKEEGSQEGLTPIEIAGIEEMEVTIAAIDERMKEASAELVDARDRVQTLEAELQTLEKVRAEALRILEQKKAEKYLQK